MENPILYIPILTTVISFTFAAVVFRRYRTDTSKLHLLWWSLGIALFGVGTMVEGTVAVIGWEEPLFRAWYISGALLGGAPLAQGTVYLLMPRRRAHLMAIAVFSFVAVAAVFVVLTPVTAPDAGEDHRLAADAVEWTWVRGFSPLVNTYAAIFLIGGAIYSAAQYRRTADTRERFLGNVFIAIGAILPGIGGSFTRAGYTEVLYVTEFLGIIFIYVGYRYSVKKPARPAAGLAPGTQPSRAG